MTTPIRVPDELVDPGNSRQPHGSKLVRARALLMATQNVWPSSWFTQLRDANPQLAGMLYAGNIAPQQLDDEHDPALSTAERGSAHQAKRLAALEWPTLTTLTRMRNQFVTPFLVICVSVMAFKCSVAEDFFRFMTFNFLVLSKHWTEEFLADLATEVTRDTGDENTDTRLLALDNKAYLCRIVHQHEDRKGEFLETVNWITVKLDKREFPTNLGPSGCEWHDGTGAHETRRMLAPKNSDVENMVVSAWRDLTGTARNGFDILAHPDVQPAPRPECIVYQTPILDVGTARHADMAIVLDTIMRKIVWGVSGLLVGGATAMQSTKRLCNASTRAARSAVSRAAKLAMAVGDQQTYSRMHRPAIRIRVAQHQAAADAPSLTHPPPCRWSKKQENPEGHKWLLPLDGGWHFLANSLECVHLLWWFALGARLSTGTGREKTVEHKWTIESFKYYGRSARLERPAERPSPVGGASRALTACAACSQTSSGSWSSSASSK
jgi:hypothetical protein